MKDKRPARSRLSSGLSKTGLQQILAFCCRYSDLTECMGGISVEELIMAVRRQSQGFSRGTSAFRGVTHHPSGIWHSALACFCDLRMHHGSIAGLLTVAGL